MLGVGGSEWSSIYGVDGRGFRKACPSVVVACSGSRVNFATRVWYFFHVGILLMGMDALKTVFLFFPFVKF
jgi:hypothetical protein